VGVEITLEQFVPLIWPAISRQDLLSWWLVHFGGRRGNPKLPVLDLISTCTVECQKGLVLIEGKAHDKELKKKGSCGSNNEENRERISQAISEAMQALEVNIPWTKRYQLANRIAFSWKIASLGVPVILVYLGFLGDEDAAKYKRGTPFKNDEDWQEAMLKYMGRSAYKRFMKGWIPCGKALMQMIIRSLPVE